MGEDGLRRHVVPVRDVGRRLVRARLEWRYGAWVAPVAIGAIAYTVGAVAYLISADPDRGDLPLALAITSFLPTTTLLVANIATDHPDDKKIGS